jgi:hypothetical protein
MITIDSVDLQRRATEYMQSTTIVDDVENFLEKQT